MMYVSLFLFLIFIRENYVCVLLIYLYVRSVFFFVWIIIKKLNYVFFYWLINDVKICVLIKILYLNFKIFVNFFNEYIEKISYVSMFR